MLPLARHEDPIVAVATASGRGAVGIVRVSGTSLAPLIAAICGRALAPRQATFGPFLDARGTPIDQGLALFFPAPNSYTGEDVLELQGHGGPVVLQLLLARCLEAAAERDEATGRERLPHLRIANPGEFTERAFLNDKLDLAQAEAVADLIDASTEAAARSAARSLDGAFSSEIDALAAALVELRLLVEATLDFPEEEIEFLERAGARRRLAEAIAQLAAVRATARQGALLTEGIRVVLAGQPNVGKSSLLNAITNRNGLARTSNTPGRTQELNIFDVGEPPQIRLIDMPGYGFAEAPKDIVKRWRFLINDYLRGRQVLRRTLVLVDSRHGLKPVDHEVMNMLDAAAVSYHVVLTKADKIKPTELAAVLEATAAEARKRPAAHPDILSTSAETGLGIPELRAAVIEAIG